MRILAFVVVMAMLVAYHANADTPGDLARPRAGLSALLDAADGMRVEAWNQPNMLQRRILAEQAIAIYKNVLIESETDETLFKLADAYSLKAMTFQGPQSDPANRKKTYRLAAETLLLLFNKTKSNDAKRVALEKIMGYFMCAGEYKLANQYRSLLESPEGPRE
jgi:hypothetical protein